MLHRQKALLAILQQVGGQASSMQIMKWAFLAGQETASQGGKTFYKFVPYRYGPYSFTLNREMDSLVRNGLVEKSDQKTWDLTTVGQDYPINLPKQISRDIQAITKQYGMLSSSNLSELVYARYPWFTVNSNFKEKRRERRPEAEKAIYTAGYEGKTVDEFLNLLMRSGIFRLIDVRYNPISRRYGFHKSTLKRLCESLSIDYQHLPSLGIPGSARANLNSGKSYMDLFEEYRCGLPDRKEDVQQVIPLLQSKPSVLVCMEENPEFCHRNVLAQHLMGIIGLPVMHLRYSTCSPSLNESRS